MTSIRNLARCALATVALLGAAHAHATAVVDCTFAGSAGDTFDRGFYVQDYAGATLRTVRVAHKTIGVEGTRFMRMTARLGAYNGPVLGVSNVTRRISNDWTITSFDFGDVAVPEGSTITFAQELLAGDVVTYNTGAEPCAATQTLGTLSPLDSFRRASVGVVIDGAPRDTGPTVLVSCPFKPDSGGDNLARGFYVENYPGTTLDSITLRFNGSGSQVIELQARLDAFDGPLLGNVRTTPKLTANNEVVFDFNVPVPPGSRIVFMPLLVAGNATLQTGFAAFEEDDTTTCPGVVQTGTQAPPLSQFRRAGLSLKIVGRAASGAKPAVEYLHTGFGHYFMTADADEIAGLDGGAFGGVFQRTGKQFLVYDGPVAGAVPVCRFFTIAFAPKSSHFYTADPVECEGVKLNPDWQYEKIAFQIAVPVNGACAAGTVPVYRMYNNGQTGAPNHRFTTELALYETFTTTMGWAPEGIKFCAPAT